MKDAVTLFRDGAVGRIRLNRSEKKNAFTVSMWQALSAILDEASSDPGIRVLAIESTDPAIFCAGADLTEFATMAEDRALRDTSHDAMKSAITTLAKFSRPTLAIIDGPCMGAGLALAAACDIRIAGANARFSLPPAKLGLIYMLDDMARIEALIGPGHLRRMLFTAEVLDIVEAARIGLVEQVVPAEALMEESGRLAATIASLSPDSLTSMKALMAGLATGGTMDAKVARSRFLAAYDSPDFREGLAAFKERRPPRF